MFLSEDVTSPSKKMLTHAWDAIWITTGPNSPSLKARRRK